MAWIEAKIEMPDGEILEVSLDAWENVNSCLSLTGKDGVVALISPHTVEHRGRMCHALFDLEFAHDGTVDCGGNAA